MSGAPYTKSSENRFEMHAHINIECSYIIIAEYFATSLSAARVSQPVENRDIEKILINNIVSLVIINTRDKRT